MAFHRLTSIADAYDYVVGANSGSFPVGYDYINNTPGETQAGADGVRTTSPYDTGNGTYFVGWQDDATDPNANRPHAALAENDDIVDDFLHKAMGIPATWTVVPTGSPIVSVTIPAAQHIWMGDGSVSPNKLIRITDVSGASILDTGLGTYTTVGSASPAPGDSSYTTGKGFATTDVVLTFNIPLPAGVPATIHYIKRGCIADLPRDFLIDSVMARNEVPGPVGVALNALDAHIDLVEAFGLGGVYVRGPAYPVSDDLPDLGTYILRNHYAPTVYSKKPGSLATNYDSFDACWRASIEDAVGTVGLSERLGGSSGFVAYGNFHRGDSSEANAPTVAGLWTMHAHMLSDHPDKANFDTYIDWDGPCSVAFDMVSSRIKVTLSGVGNRFWATHSGTKYATVTTGVDVLMVYNAAGSEPKRVAYLIDALDPTNAQVAYLRRLDGTDASGLDGAAFTGTVRWLSTSVANSLGAAEYWNKTDGTKTRIGFTGLQYLSAPVFGYGQSANYPAGTPASFYAQSTTTGSVAWGARTYGIDAITGRTGLVAKGMLRGDGAVCTDKLTEFTYNSGITIPTGVTLSMGAHIDGGTDEPIDGSGLLSVPFISSLVTNLATNKYDGWHKTNTVKLTTLQYFHVDLGTPAPVAHAGAILVDDHLSIHAACHLDVATIRGAGGTSDITFTSSGDVKFATDVILNTGKTLSVNTIGSTSVGYVDFTDTVKANQVQLTQLAYKGVGDISAVSSITLNNNSLKSARVNATYLQHNTLFTTIASGGSAGTPNELYITDASSHNILCDFAPGQVHIRYNFTEKRNVYVSYLTLRSGAGEYTPVMYVPSGWELIIKEGASTVTFNPWSSLYSFFRVTVIPVSDVSANGVVIVEQVVW